MSPPPSVGSFCGLTREFPNSINTIRNPNIRSVKGESCDTWRQMSGENHRAVTRPQFGYLESPCHPDVRTIECNTERGVDRSKRTQVGAIARPQLGYGDITVVCYPDVGPVERHV